MAISKKHLGVEDQHYKPAWCLAFVIPSILGIILIRQDFQYSPKIQCRYIDLHYIKQSDIFFFAFQQRVTCMLLNVSLN